MKVYPIRYIPEIGHLRFIHQFFKKLHRICWPQQPPTGAIKFNVIFMILSKKVFFKKSK